MEMVCPYDVYRSFDCPYEDTCSVVVGEGTVSVLCLCPEDEPCPYEEEICSSDR